MVYFDEAINQAIPTRLGLENHRLREAAIISEMYDPRPVIATFFCVTADKCT